MGQLCMDYPWEMNILDTNKENEMRTNTLIILIKQF